MLFRAIDISVRKISDHGRSSLGPEFEDIHEAITSASVSTSFEICARRMPESVPKVVPTSLATASHGVPAVRFARSSPPRFTAQPLLVEHQEAPEETKHNYFARIIKSLFQRWLFSNSKTWKAEKENSTCCNGRP